MTNCIKNLAYVVVLAGLLGQACTQSNFTGSGAAKKASADAKKDDGGDDTDGKTPDGKDTDGKDVDGKDVDDKGKTDSETDESGNGGLGEEEDCLARRAEFYNLMLVFDRSGSQKETDPTLVRRDGAIAFVDHVYEFIQKNPKVKAYVSSLAFNSESVRGSNGWQRLKDTSLQVVKTDINTATSNPDGDTAYSPVLKDAANFFEQINKTTNADRTRNYLVFLTDGQPSAAESPLGIGKYETLGAINSAVDNLVKNYGVAMIAIASGQSISPQGEQIVQSMALPTTGIKDKNHVGIYRRARTADELRSVFDQLLTDINTCKN